MTRQPAQAGGPGASDPGDPLEAVAQWPGTAAAGWCTSREHASTGPDSRAFPWASVTKLVTALAVWVAVEEQVVSWDDRAGPAGSTLRHLMAHASGLAPDDDAVLAPPGRRRIYSNRGIEIAAEHVARAASLPFGLYLHEAVLDPLGMDSTVVEGSPAWGATGPLGDLLSLAGELLQPTLVARPTWETGTSTAFPGLRGVLPGFGAQEHNDWGLGVEIRDHKKPHWTGLLNSAATFGHFGRSGSFLWVDPVAAIAAASVSDHGFGPWSATAWPELSDGLLRARDRGRSGA